MKTELNQTDATYSLRSQRNLVEEDQLRGNLQWIDDLIGGAERKILQGEKDKASLLRTSGRKVDHSVLSMVLEELEDTRRKLEAYKEERASVEKMIVQLAPSPGALGARAKEQQQLGQLAAERLEKDKRVNDLVGSLRQALQERAGLTVRMNKSASILDFTSNDDFLDARRFDELPASLPEDLLVWSENRAAWFLGKQKDVKAYIVRDRLLVIPETLASHGVYHFGDRIELTEERARELMREDRPAPTNDAPWRCAPPSIMTVKAWEAATVSAAEHGITVEETLLWDDWERDAKDKQRFDAAGASTLSTEGEVDDTVTSIPLTEDREDLVKVKARAKGELRINDQIYGDGDVFEVPMGRWSGAALLRDGQIARP
jgi:hypothetical protein